MTPIETRDPWLWRFALAAGLGVILLAGACVPYDYADERATARANILHDGKGPHDGGRHS